MKKKKKNKENWDMYLTEEAQEYYDEKCQPTPRQWEILTLIMDEKSIDKLPFKPNEDDLKYYNDNKEYYEHLKKMNGGKPVYFKFPAD